MRLLDTFVAWWNGDAAVDLAITESLRCVTDSDVGTHCWHSSQRTEPKPGCLAGDTIEFTVWNCCRCRKRVTAEDWRERKAAAWRWRLER